MRLALALLVASAAPGFAGPFHSPDPRKRARAVDAIIRSDDVRRATELYGQLAREDDAEVRAAIALALGSGRLRTERGFKTLIELMQSDPSHQVRLAAAQSLLQFEGVASLERVAAFLKEEKSEELRVSVCGAVGNSAMLRRHPMATQILLDLLTEDPSAPVRSAAVLALGKRGDRRAIGALRRTAEKDPDKDVRRLAQKASAALEAPR